MPGDSNGDRDVFLYDSLTTTLIGIGLDIDVTTTTPTISDDGKFIAYVS